MRVVEVVPAEQRRVNVGIPTAEDQRGVKAFAYLEVQELFGHEPRCRDTEACAERVAAFEPAVTAPESQPVQSPAPSDAVEGGTVWLL